LQGLTHWVTIEPLSTKPKKEKTMTYYKHTEGGIVNWTFEPSGEGYTQLTKKEGKRLYREQAIQKLLKMLQPGQVVYTSCDHVARSGMSRHIKCHIIQDSAIKDITYLVSIVMDERTAKSGALLIGGCGMDMGFHVVYTLGALLWPKGTPAPHGKRNGEPDSDGGYALVHKWL
jgi:hypothetical protein